MEIVSKITNDCISTKAFKLLGVRDFFCFVASSRTGPGAQKIIVEYKFMAFMKGKTRCPKASKTQVVRVQVRTEAGAVMSKLKCKRDNQQPAPGTLSASEQL